MTTSSANNSVFKGFFEKQKMIGPNFIDWYQQLRIILSIEDKLNYLEQPTYSCSVAPEEIQRNLENLHAYEMLQELKTLFAQQAEQELPLGLGYIDNLEHLGHPVSLNLGVSLILISLRKEFDSFVQNYNMHSMGKTINELHAMLKLHEKTLPKNNAPALHAIRAGKVQKGNNKHKKQQPQLAARGQNQGKGKNKLAYALKPKIPPPPKRENLSKNSIVLSVGRITVIEEELSSVLSRVAEEKEHSFRSYIPLLPFRCIPEFGGVTDWYPELRFCTCIVDRIMPLRRFKKKSIKRLVEKRVAKAIEEYEKSRANLDSAGSSGGNPGNAGGTMNVHTEFKTMVTTEYCPATKIQRMEQELWTLTLKGDDIEAYNNRFHELALSSPKFVPTKKNKNES
ncbi:hypothetical protein Tco_1253645 [Tanacetum coccineum]